MAIINAGNWWLPAIKGLLTIMLGVFIIARPLEAILGIALFIGIFTIIGGLVIAVYGFVNRKKRADWGWLVAEGLFDLLIGIAMLSYPGLSILLLTSLLGVWFVVIGIFQLVYYFRHHKRISPKKERTALLNGVVTILLGGVIIINPLGGAVGLTLIIGAAAILYGILLIYTAFRFRETGSELPPLYNEHSVQP